MDDTWPVHVAVLAAALLCYVNSLPGDFVHDDIAAVKTNPDVDPDKPLGPIFVNDFWGKRMASIDSHKSYRPLTVLTFRANAILGGLKPYGFHVVNVALHVIVTWMFIVVCKKALHWTGERLLVAGLLFATHPIHTEAVAGIVGRADLLASLFFLMAYLHYLRSLGPPRGGAVPPTGSWSHFLSSLLLGAAAMLAKEQGIMVLGVMLFNEILVIWCIFKKSPLNVFSWSLIPSIQRILVILCASILLICFRLWMLNGQLPQFSDQDNPAAFNPFLLTRGLTYSYLAAFNAWLLLAPITLSYDWQMGSIPLIETPVDLRNAATLGIVVALVLVLRYGLIMADEDEERCVLVGLALLVFPFLPASNLFVKVGFVVAERVLYLPSVGLCVLVTHGYHRLRSCFPRRLLLLRLTVLTLMLFFAAKTVQRNLVWRTRDTLFLSGLQTLPHNAKMHYNYANLQKDSGNSEKAIEHYRITLRLWPSHASAHNNLGTLLSNKTEALGHFLKAIEINPRHARAHYNLANILRDNGQIQESLEAMQVAANLEPSYSDALMGLAGLYEEIGRNHDAEQLHHALLRMEPQNADAYNNYGAFLQRTGRDNEAQHYYQRAISLEPNHTVALINAARLFRSLKHNSQAEDLYKRALSIQEDPQIQSNLAVLYLNTGRTLDARTVLERILEQHPHHLDAKVHYAQALIRERNFHQAESILLSVIDINQSHRDALHQLANLYNHINRTTEALDYILQALKICSADDVTCGQLHADYGNILKDLNDMDTAAQSYKMAVQVNPNLSHAHLNLGVIYHIKREFQLAWQHYRAAQILEPHNQLLLDNMEKLRRTELRLASLSTTERSCS